jgi:hypothetical protein
MKRLESLSDALRLMPDPIETNVTERLTVLEASLETGRALLEEAQFDGARRLAVDSLALARRAVLPGKTSAWVGEAELLLAGIDQVTGRAEQAQAEAADAVNEFRDTLPAAHPLRLEASPLAAKLGQRNASSQRP